MKRRYDNRHCIDDFLRPILNIDLLDRYHDQKKVFEKLPTNFVAGHFEYLERWELLFMYEVYNLLLNSRRSTAKEEAYADERNVAAQRNENSVATTAPKSHLDIQRDMSRKRRLYWVGYVVCGEKDMLFQNIRMYQKPPGASDPSEDKSLKAQASSSTTENAFDLRQIREHDLLILSQSEINLRGQDDIKKVSSVDFLRGLLLKHNAMFAFVTKKAQKNGFVTLQVDISKAFFLE